MKRSEMLEHIQADLIEQIAHYNNCSDKAKPHKIKNIADNILSMIEGFGMLPPIEENNYYHCDCGFVDIDKVEWEPE